MTYRPFARLIPRPLLMGSAIIMMGSLPAGCAGPSGEFPSLSRRPVEAPPSATPVPETAAAMLDETERAAFSSRISNAEAAARDSATAFTKALPLTEQTVASAQAAMKGSEAWLIGQMALSRLEQDRAGGEAALSDLDIIARELAVSGDTLLQQRVANARADVKAITDAQQARFADLARQLD